MISVPLIKKVTGLSSSRYSVHTNIYINPSHISTMSRVYIQSNEFVSIDNIKLENLYELNIYGINYLVELNSEQIKKIIH